MLRRRFLFHRSISAFLSCLMILLGPGFSCAGDALAPKSPFSEKSSKPHASSGDRESSGYMGEGLPDPLAKRWIAEMLKQGALMFNPDGTNPRWVTLEANGELRPRFLTAEEIKRYRKLIDSVAKASDPKIVRSVIAAMEQPAIKDFERRKQELYEQRMRTPQIFFPDYFTVAGGYWEHAASAYEQRLYGGGKLAERLSPQSLAWVSLQGTLHHLWKDAKHRRIAHQGHALLETGRIVHEFATTVMMEKQRARTVAVESLRRFLEATPGVVFRGMGYLPRSHTLVTDVKDKQPRPEPAASTAVLIAGDEVFILPGTQMEKAKRHVPERMQAAMLRQAQPSQVKIAAPDIFWVPDSVLRSPKNRELRRTLRGDIGGGYMAPPGSDSMIAKAYRWTQRALQALLTVMLLGFVVMPSVVPAQGLPPVPLTEETATHPLIGGQIEFGERRIPIVPMGREADLASGDLGALEREKTYGSNFQVKDKEGKAFQILAVRDGYNVKTALWDEEKKILTIVTDKYGASSVGNSGGVTVYLMGSEGKWVELMLGFHFDESSTPRVEPVPNRPPRLTRVNGIAVPVEGGVEKVEIGDIAAGTEITVPFEFMDPEGKAVKVEFDGFDPLQPGDMAYAYYDADNKVMRWTPLPAILERIKKDNVKLDIDVNLKDDLYRPYFSNTVLRIKANLVSPKGGPEQAGPAHGPLEGTLHFEGQGIKIQRGYAYLGDVFLFRIRQGALSVFDANGAMEVLGVSRHPWLVFWNGVLTILPNEDSDVAQGFTILVRDSQKNIREISITFDVKRSANAAPQWTSVNGQPVSTGPMPTVDMGEIPHDKVMRVNLGYNDAEGDTVDMSVAGIEKYSDDAKFHEEIGKNTVTFIWYPGKKNLEMAIEAGGKLTGVFKLKDKKGNVTTPLYLTFHFRIPQDPEQASATGTSISATSVETMPVSTESGVATTVASAVATAATTPTSVPVKRTALASNPLEIESVGGRSAGMVFDTAVGKPLELEVVARGLRHYEPKFWVEQGVGKMIGSRDRIGTFSFTPTKPGIYPAVLCAADQMGNRTGVLVVIMAKTASPLSAASSEATTTVSTVPAPVAPAEPGVFSWLWAKMINTPMQFLVFVLGGLGFVWGVFRWMAGRATHHASPESLAAEDVLSSAVPVQELHSENARMVQQYL